MPDTTSSGHLLSRDAFSAPLPHEPAPHTVAGEPTTGIATLGAVGGVEVGIWEITPGTVRDTEVDEIFIVLSGAGEVEIADGAILPLSPGVVVRLYAGELTTWRITETLRKVWIA